MNELTINANVLNDIRKIIEEGRRQAYATAGQIVIATYWNIGKRIVEEEQQGQERAKYGARLIANLAKQLTLEFGNGFSYRSLNEYRPFLDKIQGFGDYARVRAQFELDSFTHHYA